MAYTADVFDRSVWKNNPKICLKLSFSKQSRRVSLFDLGPIFGMHPPEIEISRRCVIFRFNAIDCEPFRVTVIFPVKTSCLQHQVRVSRWASRHDASLARRVSSARLRSVMSSDSAIMNRGTLSVPGTRETLLLTQTKLPSLRRYFFSI